MPRQIKDWTIYCGRCGFLYSIHPQPPETNFWICPDDVIYALINWRL